METAKAAKRRIGIVTMVSRVSSLMYRFYGLKPEQLPESGTVVMNYHSKENALVAVSRMVRRGTSEFVRGTDVESWFRRRD